MLELDQVQLGFGGWKTCFSSESLSHLRFLPLGLLMHSWLFQGLGSWLVVCGFGCRKRKRWFPHAWTV